MAKDDEDQLDGKEIEQESVNHNAGTKTARQNNRNKQNQVLGTYYAMQYVDYKYYCGEPINEKRGRGRPRDTNMGDIKKLLSLEGYEEMKRLAEKRKEWLQQQSKAFKLKKNPKL